MGITSFIYTQSVSNIMHLQVVVFAALITCSLSLPTRQQRLTLAQWGSYDFRDHKGPGTYAFGYDVEDPATNNIQFRQEERHINGTVTGSYGFVDPNGHVRIHHYIADHKGYRVSEENPGPSQLHPHHEPPTTTTMKPPQQQDDEYFEGEFYPPAEQVVNVQDNTQPIQFPPFVFPQSPPVYEDSNAFLLHHINNDGLNNNVLSHNPGALMKYLTRKNVPFIVYRNPYGGQLGWLKFQV